MRGPGCQGRGAAAQAGMRWMESSYPEAARGWVGFNVPMSHKITAAADLLLMPSRFEPCGLNQLYAMAYGTVPVAHATGGLRDTVLPFDPWEGAPRRRPPRGRAPARRAACATQGRLSVTACTGCVARELGGLRVAALPCDL